METFSIAKNFQSLTIFILLTTLIDFIPSLNVKN